MLVWLDRLDYRKQRAVLDIAGQGAGSEVGDIRPLGYSLSHQRALKATFWLARERCPSVRR